MLGLWFKIQDSCISPGGETGRRKGLKIRYSKECGGSSTPVRTKIIRNTLGLGAGLPRRCWRHDPLRFPRV